MKGVVIREPWISLILDGKKTWEMRSKPTKERGLIGLIKKGTKQVYGVANLVDCRPPIESYKLAGTQKYHAITTEQFAMAISNNWLTPWVLENARRLAKPVPCDHTSQVVWLDLAPSVEQSILRQFNS